MSSKYNIVKEFICDVSFNTRVHSRVLQVITLVCKKKGFFGRTVYFIIQIIPHIPDAFWDVEYDTNRTIKAIAKYDYQRAKLYIDLLKNGKTESEHPSSDKGEDS